MAKKMKPQSVKEWNAVLDNLKRTMGRTPWKQLWDSFLSSESNRGWWDRLENNNPLYAMRPEMAQALSAHGLRTKPRISARDVQSEIKFFETCKRCSNRTVGVADGRYVESPLEGERLSLKKMLERHRDLDWVDEYLRRLEGVDPDERHRLEIALEEPDEVARADVIRVAGALISTREFLQERDNLRELARRLDLGVIFPLRRVVTDFNVRRSARPPAGKLKAEQEQFHREKVGLIDRWWLSGLTTWELPVPQGALAEVPVALLSLLFGDKAVISNVVPAHFAVRRDDEHDAVGRIRSTETQLSRPDRAAISGAVDKYERAYRFWFQEMAVRQRFPDGVLPYGGGERLVNGLQKTFGVKEDQVRRIRSLYRHQFPS